MITFNPDINNQGVSIAFDGGGGGGGGGGIRGREMTLAMIITGGLARYNVQIQVTQ